MTVEQTVRWGLGPITLGYAALAIASGINMVSDVANNTCKHLGNSRSTIVCVDARKPHQLTLAYNPFHMIVFEDVEGDGTLDEATMSMLLPPRNGGYLRGKLDPQLNSQLFQLANEQYAELGR